ncbi:arginase family protein [Candidatus Bathyarchaeota archaeon]|nr:arginase family protein [Candidatus Bathyarchaeota archaeon]
MKEDIFNPVPQPFIDTSTTFDEADYVVFGAPLDLTGSYRRGSRFAPSSIRWASMDLEGCSLRTGLRRDKVRVSDIGDLKGSRDVEAYLECVVKAFKFISASGKIPVMMGGEHTVTLGALRALRPDLVVCLDAHLDLRESLSGLRLSHATFIRRAFEELDAYFLFIGCRAFSEEELKLAEEKSERLGIVTSLDILRGGPERALKALREALASAFSAYLTIDMDVLDPSAAPAVCNPVPEGLSVTGLLDIITGGVDLRFRGLDLTEVTPNYDSGLTSTQAAYIILESIYALESARTGMEQQI